jgi:DNA repair exonuclease SbcCD ATPase subunit
MFKNEKVEKVNEQLTKLETKRDEIVKTIAEMEAALDKTVELFALGEINEKDIEEAHEFLKERRAELADVERMIAKVASVKNKVKIESVPMVREWRNKQVESVQAEVDKAVKEALEAREFYVKKLAAIGQAANKIGTANAEYNALMRELGERESSATINVPHAFPEVIQIGLYPVQFLETESVGLSKASQENAVKHGTLPSWVGRDSK